MTTERLQTLKSVTMWLGVIITFCGIMLNLATGGSWQSNGLSLFGLLTTCFGHWIGGALAKHQKAEKEHDEQKMEDLMARVEYAEERFSDPDLKRIIHREASGYADEHQDDGR